MQVNKKLCNQCGKVKPLTEFSMRIGGHRPEDICNKCLEIRTQPRRPKILGRSHIPPRLAGLDHKPSLPQKRCITCNNEKPLEEFHIKNSSPDGRQDSCRDCLNERHRNNIRDRALKLWDDMIRNFAVQKKGEWFSSREVKVLIQRDISPTREYLNELTRRGYLEKKTESRRKFYRLPQGLTNLETESGVMSSK